MESLLFNLSEKPTDSIQDEYDVVIIGAGPAGLTAAIYTGRGKLSTLVLEKEVVGGEVETTDKIENYPGFPEGISGHTLSERMQQQAKHFGAHIAIGTLEDFDFTGTPKRLRFQGKDIRAKAVIIATGTTPKKLGVPGEKQFIGRGVSFCATCDAAFFANSDIAVVGCGNSGLQEGLFILKYVNKIHFIEYLPEIKAEKILVERVQQHPNVECHLNTEVVAIEGKERVNGIQIRNRATGKTERLPVQGVFVYIGLQPTTAFLKGAVKLDKYGYIETDAQMATSLPGVFAAGDVRDKNLYQITTAVADGSVAAVSAERYIENLKNNS
ncbi:thioredoxin-disulfide reductase [candidate division KSB1 bacterium 4484_188]|nr:MAG: thioredoxin-disulfide reductase [candidate division KSB1 bacterium 4484_188]